MEKIQNIKAEDNSVAENKSVAQREMNLTELFFVLLALFIPFSCGLAINEKYLGSWSFLVIAVSAGLAILLCFLYYFWFKTFGIMSIKDIFVKTYGNIGSIIISTIMVAACFAVILDFAYTLSYIWGLTVNVDIIDVLFVFLILVCLMSLAGEIVIGRLARLAVFLAFLLLLIGMLIVMNKGSLDNLFPLKFAGTFDLVRLNGTGFAVTFGLTLFILPFLKDIVIKKDERIVEDKKKKEKRFFFTLFAAIIAAGLFLSLIIYCNLTVLGKNLLEYELPFVQLLKQFSLGNSFNQTEIIGMMFYETIGVVGLSFMLCAMNEFAIGIFPVKRRFLLPVVWVILLFIAAYILFVKPSDMLEMLVGCTTTAVWLAAFFIPALTLLIYKIKKH